MLLLTRLPGQEIMINDGQIRIRVMGVQGTQVRLAFEAPREITIHRAEIHAKIKAEEAAQLNQPIST